MLTSVKYVGCFQYTLKHKVFPDYKHLLQETLRCTTEDFQPWIISNKMVHLHTEVQMFVVFWMQHFQTGGLGEMV